MDIVNKVRDIAERHTKERNIEIVDITYRRENIGMVLRLTVEKPDGITISECEELNNYLSEELDREDLIQDHYTIEVSSPGLDRPIKTDRDYERSMGKLLEMTTYEIIDGRKSHEGVLIGMDAEKIVLESGGVSTVIPREKIALARLKIEF